MTPLKDPSTGFWKAPENFLRRQRRASAFYFSEAFRSHLIYFGGCSLIIVFHLFVMNAPLMERFENVFVDLFFRQRPPVAMHPAIAHIDIDEGSLQTLGRWPWPRSQYAALIRILKEWGAKGIILGGDLSEPSATSDDEAMIQAIKEAGNVYLPVALESLDGKLIWVHALPEFERYAKGVGHVNIFPDRDGTIRRVAPFLSHNGETYPFLGVRAAFDYLGKDIKKDALMLPEDPQGRIFVNWVGKWKDSFKHYSFLDVVSSYAAIREGWEPFIAPDKLKGKICVIGLTAPGMIDIKANPIEGTFPAVGVQTHVMNSILQGQFVRPVASRWNSLALWVIGLLLSMAFLFSRPAFSLMAGFGAGLLWVGFAFWLFAEQGVWIRVADPLLLIISLFVFSAVFSSTIGRREQERLLTLATRDGLTGLYMIRHFRTLLEAAVTEAQKKHRPLSILLLEIDLFKKIHDEHGPLAADAVLRFVAENLKLATQTETESSGGNVLGRYGGEEFIVMLRQCSLGDAAFHYAEKIRKRFELNSFSHEGVKIPLTISIGVAALRIRETVPDMMVLRADEALYRAKTEGRNKVCIEKEA